MDLLTQYNNTLQQYDYVVDDVTGQFIQTQDIETLIQVALFTNRTSDPGWTLTKDQEGWWGEAYYPQEHIGSHLWQLQYLNQSEYTDYAQSFVNDALQFLLDYNLCDTFTTQCSFTKGALTINIQVTKNSITTDYDYVWKGV